MSTVAKDKPANQDVASALIDAALAQGRTALPESEGKELLAAYGIAVPRRTLVTSPAEGEAAAAGMKGPFVVKVSSPDILHKSDVGGVRVGLDGPQAVAGAIADMQKIPAIAKARVDGFLVEEMAPKGRELVIGGMNDSRFGPMVMVGLGGIFVEVLADVSFRLCPITKADAEAMLAELRGAKLLDGARGEKPVDRAAVVEMLLAVGGEGGLLMTHADTVMELDLNPVIAAEKGAAAVDARVLLRDKPAAAADQKVPGLDRPVLERWKAMFEPMTIAVVGASTKGGNVANTFIRRLREFNFDGDIYPIHPKADEVEGLKCYPSLAETPKPVDYTYIAIGGDAVPEVLSKANGRVQVAQVISSGFGETAEGKELEAEVVRTAHAQGCRIAGPNCLGLYSPRGKVSFAALAPTEIGTIGVATQSGGLGTDIIKRGAARGLRFSGLVTLGNCSDISPVDMVEYYLADPQTKVIGLYLEELRDGRRFFDLLRTTPISKPVVVLKGGRSSLGQAAAASHTGALAGDFRAWEALAAQTPCALVKTVDEFIDALLAFQNLQIRVGHPTRKITLFGNGGGTSVLATDFFADYGLDTEPFPKPVREKLEALQLPPGTSVANPIDAPVRTLQQDDGKVASTILDIIYNEAETDAIVMHINLSSFVGREGKDPIDTLITGAVEVAKRYADGAHLVMVVRSDGSQALDDRRRDVRDRALAAGIPVYDEMAPAALALNAVKHIESRMAAHRNNTGRG